MEEATGSSRVCCRAQLLSYICMWRDAWKAVEITSEEQAADSVGMVVSQSELPQGSHPRSGQVIPSLPLCASDSVNYRILCHFEEKTCTYSTFQTKEFSENFQIFHQNMQENGEALPHPRSSSRTSHTLPTMHESACLMHIELLYRVC